MEVLQPAIGPVFGDRQARSDIFRETGVVACRKRLLFGEAETARHHAERTLGHDMDVVCLALFDELPDPAGRGQRQPDVRIGRQRQGAKEVRRQESHLDAKSLQHLGQALQSVYDAVDLGTPGVGDHHYVFRSAPTRGCKAVGGLFEQTRLGADFEHGAWRAFDHRFMTAA